MPYSMTSATSCLHGKSGLTIAVETSTALGSLALFDGSNLIEQKTWHKNGSHSEFVTASFSEILDTQKVAPSEIAQIAVGLGPGSFTGIRVAVNFARTLGYALSVPIIGQNSLELLAYQQGLREFEQPIFVLQYGFRDIFYGAQYKYETDSTGQAYLREIEKPFAVLASEVPKWIPKGARVIGRGMEHNETSDRWDINTNDKRDPEAAFFSGTLVRNTTNLSLSNWIHTIPLYIRASEAEEKMRSSAF